GRGTDILLGGNPEYLAKQELRNEGIESEKIELASSFVADVDDEIKELRQRYNELLAKHQAVTEVEKEEVKALGGLYIIGTERHESRRIDNQLRGRAGRQGDPGKSQFYISLEDDLAKRFGGERMKRMYAVFKVDDETPLVSKMLSRSIENAQRTIEGQNFGIRKNVIQYDDVMNTQRMVIYKERNKVINGENIHDQILKYIPDYAINVLAENADLSKNPTKWNLDKVNKALQARVLNIDTEFLTEDNAQKWDTEYVQDKLVELAIEQYEEKIVRYREEEGIDFFAIERDLLLNNVDRRWIDHIDNMDRLKRGISLRSFANEDPINAYKREGMEMFDEMIDNIRTDTVFFLLKMELRKNEPQQPKKYNTPNKVEIIEDKKTIKTSGLPGRNDPCPCGSGKKYKNCCGK
ncbi:MAG: SEC-C domain-containing protein, partial [Clostridia bacterium]|nr:SEC-C domain-containing protein [Clostridia bacterium]